jgi:hypothetical protein
MKVNEEQVVEVLLIGIQVVVTLVVKVWLL